MPDDWQDTFDRLAELDKQFRYQQAAPVGVEWFEVVNGTVPVLVSAPHACMHVREGVRKMQEEFTGALALYLAERCGCYAIFTRYQTHEDPNWQVDSKYKRSIEALLQDRAIRFVIDLHGMTNRYHMGVALGTINGESCEAESVIAHFLQSGFIATAADNLTPDVENAWRRLVVDHPKFTGGVVNNTVTRFASQQLGVPSVQIELSSEARVVESAATEDWPHEYRGNSQAIAASVTALEQLVAAFT